MSVISVDYAARLLSDLVALPTVNPMGRPHTSAEPVERSAADYLAGRFGRYGVEMERLRPNPIHESLLVRVAGRQDGPYTLLESHPDTVPADDYGHDDPRRPDPQCSGRRMHAIGRFPRASGSAARSIAR